MTWLGYCPNAIRIRISCASESEDQENVTLHWSPFPCDVSIGAALAQAPILNPS